MEIATALASAMQLVSMARLAVDARDDAKLRAALTDLTLRLSDAAMSALASAEKANSLVDEVRALQDQIRALKEQAEERDRYTLAEIRPGAYAYQRKAGQPGHDTPAHYLCQPCYDKQIKSILRRRPASVSGDGQWVCPEETKHTITENGTQTPMNIHASARFKPSI